MSKPFSRPGTDSPPRPRAPAHLLIAAALVAGCATPLPPKEDAQFQSYASASDRPATRPVRSMSSFSDSLACMDEMMREAEVPTMLITSTFIPDFSGRVPVAAKQMVVTALSQMSRRSNAFRYVDFEVDIARQDTVQNLTTILLNNNQMQLQRPALYFSGAVAYVDQNVIGSRFDVGTSASRLDTGYSASRNATVIGLELHLGDFRTRTLIPGLDSANEVIIGGAGQGLDVAGRIGSYGVKFNVGRDYTQGAGGAMRTLIDLGTIELVGKWARVPYWQCLTLDQTHPDFQRQMREWYDESGPEGQMRLVQSALARQGYLPPDTEALSTESPELRTALARFQADRGIVVSGVLDFTTYERALRNFVTLSPSGTLSRVGWNSQQLDAPGTTPPGAAPLPAVAAADSTTRVELQIENPLPAGERPAFEEGDQVFLSATVSRTSYLYCYFQDAQGNVMRLLPNSVNPKALVSAHLAVRIPDWMTPNPAFILDTGKPGTEQVGCFASETDPYTRLPAPLQGAALTQLQGYRSLDDVAQGFSQGLGPQGFARGSVHWQVVAKRAPPPAAPAPAAAPATPAKTR